MAANLLRASLLRGVQQRTFKFSARATGYGAVVTEERLPSHYHPDLNAFFFESVYQPIPEHPRTIAFHGELAELKARERGDWKQLSVDEQMDLYNMYFGMSMADMHRGTDQWKTVIGMVFIVMSLALSFHWFLHAQLLPPQQKTLTDPQWVKDTVKRQLQMHSNPITGIASKWDYEKGCWK